jgi:osmoprotectant transport system permease protein
VILAGALPAAALALLVDGALGWLGRTRDPRRRLTSRRLPLAAAALLLATAIALPLVAADRRETIVVGSKNFTEQHVLGELLAQTIEAHTSLPVTRRLNLGGTFVCDRALRTGDLDAYVEYTGTALTAIFKEQARGTRAEVAARTRELYAGVGLTMLAPLGFNNTFAMLVRRETAERLGVTTLSAAVPHARSWRAGFGYEFLERADGFRGLAARYGLQLAAPPRVMDLSLSYRALASGGVDLIAGDATAGLIPSLDLVVLEDDLGYFPPYDAVPVVSARTALRHPAIVAAVSRLAGRVSEQEMQAMNAQVDLARRDPRAVVRDFLERTRNSESW